MAVTVCPSSVLGIMMSGGCCASPCISISGNLAIRDGYVCIGEGVLCLYIAPAHEGAAEEKGEIVNGFGFHIIEF